MPIIQTFVRGGKKICGSCLKEIKIGDAAIILKKTKRKWYHKSCAEQKNII